MSHPNKEQVWAATINDPEFAEQMPEGSPQREAIRPFIEGSVEVLSEMFDIPVSLQSIADAKIRFLRYCLSNGIGKIMADALSDLVLVDEDMFTALFNQLIDMFEAVAEDVDAFLEGQGITEEQVMLSPQIGLNADNQQLWQAGELTISDILLTQPGVILKNGE